MYGTGGAKKYGGGALGRALFNALDQDDQADRRQEMNQIGRRYAPKKVNNPQRVEHKRQVHNDTRVPTKTSQRAVAVPKNFAVTRPRKQYHPIDCTYKKKSDRAIAADTNNYAEQALPMYRPRPSNEERILRLQKGMEFGDRPPEPVKKPLARLPVKRDGRSEAQRLFDETQAEIDERQSFLVEMREIGKGKEYDAIISGEIAERVRDLKALDKLISSEE